VKWMRTPALGLLLALAALAAPRTTLAAPAPGKLSGVVVDAAGVPQMGASVSIIAEDLFGSAAKQVLSNDRGMFSADQMTPGMYSVRVTLAGFLPAFERHVKVESSLTTLITIEMDSLLTSFERLRRRPNQGVDSDEWMWVLRTSAATRPVLRFADGVLVLDSESSLAEETAPRRVHGRLELASGARRPGSVSNVADAPSTAFAYEQKISRTGKLLLAGQMSYERSAAAGFASTWLPLGDQGPQTTLVLRQANLGPGREDFRGARVQHESNLRVGERLSIRYGAEYILVGLGRSTSSLRPQAEAVYELSPEWRASFTMASRPWSNSSPAANNYEAVLNQLDAFPAVLMRDGRPVLAGGWHEEIAVERHVGADVSIITSLFRDRARNTAVFGRGLAPGADFFQDFFSSAFAYDGGGMNRFGARLAYRQKLGHDTQATLVYAMAGALVPQGYEPGMELRDALYARNIHSMAARLSTRVPRTGTDLAASYKWIQGSVVTRHDPFGEITYQLDPYLNLTVRQPLSAFLLPGRLEATVDFRNLLAQGYVPIQTADGQIVLTPALRTFRGGFTLQF